MEALEQMLDFQNFGMVVPPPLPRQNKTHTQKQKLDFDNFGPAEPPPGNETETLLDLGNFGPVTPPPIRKSFGAKLDFVTIFAW